MFKEIEKKRSIIATLKAETDFFLFVDRVGLELLPVQNIAQALRLLVREK